MLPPPIYLLEIRVCRGIKKACARPRCAYGVGSDFFDRFRELFDPAGVHGRPAGAVVFDPTVS